MGTDKKDLLDFSKRWDQAMVSNDVNEIGKFMSDTWIIIGSNGITPKSTFLQMISSGALTHSRMDSDEDNIIIYGNTGILVSRGTSAGKFNGQEFSLYEWSTSIFMKTGRKWQCVLTMLTPANKS
ncbi:MAG TPA: nuclear transport factor 2 family protein [Chitinophagaceae bacterium]|nr:nuclear transport factor 2 family protein [Chitinophagaceae bacterium]